MKKRLLFVITQFYKGGAEVALLNLFNSLSNEEFEIDFLVFDQMILNNATSLLPKVPSWIRVCNAAEKEGKAAIILKVLFKVVRKLTKRQLYRPQAFHFVKKKEYDIAFSYGEWMSPEFVAKKVSAKRKYIWIHTDIDKAPYVDKKILFRYDEEYTGYIFVSEQSKSSAESKFYEVKGKSLVIHNMCDDEYIRKTSEERVLGLEQYQRPILLTVGNLREEKNHKRQIAVMNKLISHGFKCTWINIGSTANTFLYQQLKTMVEKYNLQDSFIFLGAEENPYKYMSKVDIVTVLSDFESWSLVITEAKLLGIPVIATETSGAIEQIEDGVTGMLTSFETNEIADKIHSFFENPKLVEIIRTNLRGFSTKHDVMIEFKKLLRSNLLE